ncbi:hypothetical protein OQA88_11542 [Cercophora sp. LCS_1]
MAVTPTEYIQYVKALAADFPHLKPLQWFTEKATPKNVQADSIHVFDVSTSGELTREHFGTVSGVDASTGSKLLSKLAAHPPDLDVRVVSVSHLTPTAASILGSYYNLSADFLNAHLPQHPSRLLTTDSHSSLHIDLIETFHVDDSRVVPVPAQKLRAQYGPNAAWRNTVIWAAIRNAVDRCFIQPWCVPADLFGSGPVLGIPWFMMHQRVSIHVSREGTADIVIVLHYPTPELTIDTPLRLRKRFERLATPSEWRASTRDHSRLDNLDQHLCSLLEKHLAGTRHGVQVALQQIFSALEYSLVPTTWRLAECIAVLGNLYRLQSPDEDSTIMHAASRAQRLQGWVRHAVDILDRLSQGETRENDTAVSKSTDPAVQAEWQRLSFQYRKTLDTLDRLTAQSHQLAQTRLVYTQIAESRKAIAQADGVRRLTTLAFVFIPLTYVASVFSAGIDDMDGTRNAKNFALSSVLTTAAAILASLTLEQYLWPFVVGWVDKWREHVYTVLAALDDDDKTFDILECIFRWRIYFWGSWNLIDDWENYAWLPLATIDLGRWRVRQLVTKLFRRKKKEEAVSP